MSEPLIMFTEEQKSLIKRTVAAGASAEEFALFWYQVERTGLDPICREIYFVKRQGKGTIQTGIDGLLKIAHRTGACAGIDDAEFGPMNERGFPSSAKVIVYKLVGGIRCPFGATARWDEYYPGDSQGFQWKRMPHVMLGKCALALALRKAYSPADMSGLYATEEMDQAGPETPPTAPTPAPVRPNPTAPVLEGAALVEAAKEAFNESHSSTPISGEGKNAFGYTPMRWPLPKMFAEPSTESQRKMLRGKMRERMMDVDDLPVVRRLVLEAYGLEDDESKAAYSLVIDWAINADDDVLDRASVAAEAQPRPDTEPF